MNKNRHFFSASILAVVAVLSACGGGSSSKTVDLGDPVSGDIPLGTFTFPVDKLNYNFDEALHVSYWTTETWNGEVSINYRWESGMGRNDPATPDDQGALLITPSWTGGSDQFIVSTDFATDVKTTAELERDQVDLTCADLRFYIYMPAAYVTDGNMGVKFFVRDTAGRYASLGWNSVAAMTGDAWNLIDITNIVPATFDYADTDFDFSQAQVIGVEFNANGKPAEVTSDTDIRVDNILIAPAAIQDCLGNFELVDVFLDDFDTPGDTDPWNEDFADGGLTYTVSRNSDAGNPNGAMQFEFNWVDASADKLLFARNIPAIDLTAKSVRVDVYIPQAYVDDGNMGLKIFTKDTGFRYGSLGWVSTSGLRGDSWNTIEVADIENSAASFDFRADGYDPTAVGLIGVEFVANGKANSVNGNILVDNVRILEVVEVTDPLNMAIDDNFDSVEQIDNWEFDYGEGSITEASVTVSHDTSINSGAMALDIIWGNASTDKLLYRRVNFPEIIDLTGAVVRADVYFPAAYVNDGNMGMKIFTKDSNWNYASLGWIGVGGLSGDTWNTIEITVTDESVFDFIQTGYDITQVDKIGVEFVANGKGTGVTGTLYIDNVEIIVP